MLPGPSLKPPLPKLKISENNKTPHHFSARSTENVGGILNVYKDLQGKFGKNRQAFENNKKPSPLFKSRDLEIIKTPLKNSRKWVGIFP